MTDSSRLYEKGGNLENWNALVEQTDPNYGNRLFNLLKEESIIPIDLDNFRFLSVSANGGVREILFAEALDKDIKSQPKKPKKKPTIIASDIVNVDYQTPELETLILPV